jgi:hypothetical protein
MANHSAFWNFAAVKKPGSPMGADLVSFVRKDPVPVVGFAALPKPAASSRIWENFGKQPL